MCSTWAACSPSAAKTSSAALEMHDEISRRTRSRSRMGVGSDAGTAAPRDERRLTWATMLHPGRGFHKELSRRIEQKDGKTGRDLWGDLPAFRSSCSSGPRSRGCALETLIQWVVLVAALVEDGFAVRLVAAVMRGGGVHPRLLLRRLLRGEGLLGVG